jgi:hypothetical protein
MHGHGPIDAQPSQESRSVTLRDSDLIELLEVRGLGVLMIRHVARFDDPRGRFMPEGACEFDRDEVGYSPRLK